MGGNATGLYDYPWTALLRYRNERKQLESWGCSGSYIGTFFQYNSEFRGIFFLYFECIQIGGRTIVTAAHCVDDISKRDLGNL